MSLTNKGKRRIKEFYREVEGISIPVKLLFDPEFSPSEKLCLALLSQLAELNAIKDGGQYCTDFTNGEIDTLLGGVSIRSLHRHFRRFRQKGLIKIEILNTPRPNSRTIYLTPKAIKYMYDIEVGESITVATRSDAYIY